MFHLEMRLIRHLKSNVCICHSLTRRGVYHNAVSQWHTLLCKWGSFIILMLFMSLIHMERDVHPSSQRSSLHSPSVLPELGFVTSKLIVLKQHALLEYTGKVLLYVQSVYC